MRQCRAVKNSAWKQNSKLRSIPALESRILALWLKSRRKYKKRRRVLGRAGQNFKSAQISTVWNFTSGCAQIIRAPICLLPDAVRPRRALQSRANHADQKGRNFRRSRRRRSQRRRECQGERDIDPIRDARLKRELLSDEKELTEHRMPIDLACNDALNLPRLLLI